jgi:hypothetical protein
MGWDGMGFIFRVKGRGREGGREGGMYRGISQRGDCRVVDR